jgi:hypothetical protein
MIDTRVNRCHRSSIEDAGRVDTREIYTRLVGSNRRVYPLRAMQIKADT